jgi:hypothetical protein
LTWYENDWNAVYAQVMCLWGSDPTSDMLLSAASYFQIYDDINEGTVAAGAMSIYWGSWQSLLPQMQTLPLPIELGSCQADFKQGP